LELESKQTSENQKKKICADKRGLSTIPLGDKISSDFQKKYQGTAHWNPRMFRIYFLIVQDFILSLPL